MIPADWTEFTTPDGLLTLRLPADWDMEDEEDDGTTLFAPEDEEAGALRVTPMIYAKEKPVEPRELPRLLAKRGPRPLRVTDTRYILHRLVEDEEDGEPLIQHIWEMIEQIDPQTIAIVIASYTLGLHETLVGTEELTRRLEASLRECVIDATEDEEDEETDEAAN
jgi:hypothetical protein